MKKILSLLLFAAMAVVANAQDPVKFIPSVEDGNLVIKYENNSGKTIANCNFQLKFDEGVSIATDEDDDYIYEKGGSTAKMKVVDVAYNATTGKYTITIYNGKFNDASDGVIISFPLKGDLTGKNVAISGIAFGDPDAANICRPADIVFALGAGPVVTDPVELTASVEDGNLVFKYKNNSGKTIANCNFQLKFDEGVSIATDEDDDYIYEKGGSTAKMKVVDVAYNATTGKYTITIYNGKFNDASDGVIISFPLEGDLTGKSVTVSGIAFGDPDAANICRPDDFVVNLAGTAINSISADETKSGVIYNLSGQRVSKAVNGIFIIDGKKVAVTK